MIISRKRFEAEIRRRARRICREKDMVDALELSAHMIAELEKRIRRLEKQKQNQNKNQNHTKGDVKGFYVSPGQGVINCNTKFVEAHSLDNEG